MIENTVVSKIHNFISKFFDSIVPIFEPFAINAKFIGSSVYFTYCGNYYLCSAHHVFENHVTGLVIPTTPTTLDSIPTSRIYNITNESVDLGVCKLIDRLELFMPIELDDNSFSREAHSENLHVLLGFPGTKTKTFGGKARSKLDVMITKEASQDEYLRLGINKNLQIASHFDRNNVIRNGKVQRTSIPNGMSGGCLLSFDKEDPSKIDFEGVMVRWDPERETTVISTKKRLLKILLDKMSKETN